MEIRFTPFIPKGVGFPSREENALGVLIYIYRPKEQGFKLMESI